ncbi:hypothetical protein BT63DRAFT_466579 [Microthyrium microscopicum]|uniref:Uncharacterized protein n=1 Tax=Microthyrium microscopicum TaxID=703497 RepID=A0A6A6UL76_9PEZI|nr:hypothetical protein BT63DRAFT_466579 [Microthyrium microscopicum]
MELTPDRLIAIEEIRQKNPRFLFRTFSESSGRRREMGFIPDQEVPVLNSGESIVPLGYLKFRTRACLKRRIHDIQDLEKMVHDHIGAKYCETEFTSWTPSIVLVLAYACQKFRNGENDVGIAMLDTYQPGVYAYPVHALHLCSGCCRMGVEYLVHGVIRHPKFSSVLLKSWLHTGWMPSVEIARGIWGYGVRDPKWAGPAARSKAFTSDELDMIVRVVQLYARREQRDMAIALTAALLNMRCRPWHRRPELYEQAWTKVFNALREHGYDFKDPDKPVPILAPAGHVAGESFSDIHEFLNFLRPVHDKPRVHEPQREEWQIAIDRSRNM